MTSPLPTPPARLSLAQTDGDDPLIRFDFGRASGLLSVPCPRLAGPSVPENWFAGPISESAQTVGAAWAHSEHYAMVAIEVDEFAGDIAQAAELAYQRLLTCVRPSAHPFLLRIWNYFSDINQGEDDQERYRRFCMGRALGVDGAFNDPPPAATAIGGPVSGNRLQVIALCARVPALALENPRQTPAWRYPREFGPVSPGFSRGVLIDRDTERPRLLASGTASIVGHLSQHVGNTGAQLEESLINLRALLAEGQAKSARDFSMANCEALRVYLRHARDLEVARSAIESAGLPIERVLYLHGDICRRELDVEVEGVFVAD